jgi:hypothetical protein
MKYIVVVANVPGYVYSTFLDSVHFRNDNINSAVKGT